MGKSSKYIQIIYNFPIMISPLGSIYVSEKHITLKEIDRIQQGCKNHSANHYMSSQEAIGKLGIKIDGSTFQACIQPSFKGTTRKYGNW